MSILLDLCAERLLKGAPLNVITEACKKCKQFKECSHCYDRECGVLISMVKQTGYITQVGEDEEGNEKVELHMSPESEISDVKKNILAGLLQARYESKEKGVLTNQGMTYIIDALFYLVSESIYKEAMEK